MSKRTTFIRQDTHRYLKLGSKAKKKQKWRRARGRHSKVRRSRAGHPSAPVVGFGNKKSDSGKVRGFIPILISNLSGLQNIQKGEAAILSSKIGARKKIELIKKADELKIKILNVKESKK